MADPLEAPREAPRQGPVPGPRADGSGPRREPASDPTSLPAPGDAPGGKAGIKARRVGFHLFAGHLFALVGIALSNLLAGVLLLSSPWTVGRRRLAAALSFDRAPDDRGSAGAVAAPRRWLLAGLAVYVAWLVVSVLASYDPAASSRGFSELFTLLTLVFALAILRDEARLRWVVDGLGLVGGGAALWGLVQLFIGYGEIHQRIRGPFSHWMTFAGFLLICDLLLLAALLFRAGELRRRSGWGAVVWRLAAVVLMTGALFASLTRSAWVGLVVGLLLALVLRSRRSLLLLPVAALLFVLLAPVPLLHRVASTADLTDPSNYDRLCMAEAAVRMVADRPVTGLGPEMVEPRYPIYRPPTAPRYSVPHLHNTYLQLAAERGVPALLAYLALILAPLAAAWRLYRREGGRRGPRADLLVGTLAALAAFHTAAFFEYNWGDTEVQRLVLFLLAVPFCLAVAAPRGGEAPEPAEERAETTVETTAEASGG